MIRDLPLARPLAVLTLAASASAQSPSMASLRETLPPDEELTNALALGDLDGDGDLDLFAGNEFTCQVYRWSEPDGYVEVFGAVGLGAGFTCRDVVLGDFDGDGNLDALLGQNGYGSLLPGDGTGAFDLVFGAVPPGAVGVLAAADLDNDGDLDALSGAGSAVLRNDAGTFTKVALPFLGTARDAALGDVDQDGDLDAIVAAGDARLLIHDGALGFVESPGALALGGATSTAIALADLDGDGALDVAVGNGTTTAEQGYAFRGDGAGGFALQTTLPMPAAKTTGLVATDVDGDGDADLLESSTTGATYTENLGGFAFADVSSKLKFAPQIEESLAASDVDGDGDVDLLLARNGPNRLLLQSSGGDLVDASAPWPNVKGGRVLADDWNGDGALDAAVLQFDQVRIYLGDGYGELSPTPATQVAYASAQKLAGEAADLGADGDVDLFLAIFGGASRVYRNDGAGGLTYDAAALSPADFQLDDVALGDLDGDGHVDAFGAKDGPCVLFLGDGSGAFVDQSVPLITQLGSVSMGDIDLDGALDVYCGSYVADAWYEYSAPLPFALGGVTTIATSYRGAALFDADADGDLDVAGNDAQNLVFLRNQGGGVLVEEPPAVPALNLLTTEPVPFDLEGDGDLDLLVPRFDGQNRVLANTGAGTFAIQPGAISDLGAVVYGAAAADLDGDEDNDLLLATLGDVRVLNGTARHLARRVAPRVGKPLGMEVFGPVGEPWFLAYSPGITAIPLGAFGTLRLDPAHLLVLASGVLDGFGHGGVTLPLPSDPGLVGVSLGTQAAVGLAPRFTNLERIVPTAL